MSARWTEFTDAVRRECRKELSIDGGGFGLGKRKRRTQKMENGGVTSAGGGRMRALGGLSRWQRSARNPE